MSNIRVKGPTQGERRGGGGGDGGLPRGASYHLLLFISVA